MIETRAAELHAIARDGDRSLDERLTAALDALHLHEVAAQRDAVTPAPVLRAVANLRRIYADDLDQDRLALDGRPHLRNVLAAYDEWVRGAPPVG